jgi:hypothetical protein
MPAGEPEGGKPMTTPHLTAGRKQAKPRASPKVLNHENDNCIAGNRDGSFGEGANEF